MPLKNSKTVAVERRMDLASFFCMIGRHGPAVALAVIAMVSVLAGFIIYRTVRGKRRKATAAAADSDDKSPGAEKDASVIQPSPEELHSSGESTDVSDEGSSDVKEDADLIQGGLKIRHRRAAAAENKPPPYSPPSDIRVPEHKHTTSDDTEAVEWDSHKVAETYGNQSVPSDADEVVVEDAVDYHHSVTDDIVQDVIEEVCDNGSCLMEPEPIRDGNSKEEETVVKAQRQKDEHVTTDKHVSDKKTTQKEEDFQTALNKTTGFKQPSYEGEKADNDRLEDNEITLETKSVEPNSKDEDVPSHCICHGKDVDEFEEENPDGFDYISYSVTNHSSAEEEKKNEGVKEEEVCADYRAIAQQAEIWSSTSEQETTLPSRQQDQRDDVMEEMAMPIQNNQDNDGDGLAGEVTEEPINEDQLNKNAALSFDDHLRQFDEQEVEIDQKHENSLVCNREDSVLCNDANQVKEETLTSDNIVACSEECDSSSTALPHFSMSVKFDNDIALSSITSDEKAQISGSAVFPDLSLDCQQLQKEDEIDPFLDEDTISTDLGTHITLHKIENQPETNRNDTTTVLAEECSEQEYDLKIQSCYKDHPSVPMINLEVFDKASLTADPDTVENITTSVKVEEISCLQSSSICQDKESDHTENEETVDEPNINSTTDASEEISFPDTMSSSQDQQHDQMKMNEDFSGVTSGAASVVTEDISSAIFQIHSLSFEQKDNDVSSPGVGEESGISSMAVSPDIQDAYNDIDVTIENIVLPVMVCDQQPGVQQEAQKSLFADDVPVSIINEDKACMVFGPYPSGHSQVPCSEHTDWSKYESFAANEDMFGHEIEDGYHRAMDEFTAQIEASIASFTDDQKMQTDMKAVIDFVEIKEEKAEARVEEKKETKAKEREKEEDYEKTEISIMEATMDNNEWITESNYPILPWLSLSTPSFAQDNTKPNQLPTEECQSISAVTDITCMDTTDIPFSTEVKQASNLSLVDENTESNKKVVAVQPMPQNVNVTFRVHYFTQSPYQTVAVTGNHPELGNWKEFIPLERGKDGHWATVVSLSSESHVEWKFVLLDKGEVCRWEECGNRLLDTGYGDDLLVHKWWGLM